MPKQLSLGFTDAERPADSSPQMKGRGVEEVAVPMAVAEIAEALRPRVLAYLRQADGLVGIHELRTELGHPGLDTDPDPQSNPVNRILKEMRDREEVLCNQPERGEPTFTLPETSPADPPFVRPDRQEHFGGQPHYEWPEAQHDRNTITVDRVGSTAQGGPHRFTIKRGDTVQAWFSTDKQEPGIF